MEVVKWQQEFNAWEQEDIFFEQCLSTTEKEFFSLLKWKAGRVGCFCREHCETRLRLCREGKKMDHMVLKEKKRSVCHTESLVNAEMVNIAK